MIDAAICDNYFNQKESAGELEYKRAFPLSSCTSFKIGGEADYAVWPLTTEALTETVDFAVSSGIDYIVLGRASNVLVSDDGYRGIVIFTTKLKAISCKGDIIRAEAGVPLIELSVFAQKNGYSGMEFAYGIPGSVGGAVYMNAGAYEGEMKNVVTRTGYYDSTDNQIKQLCGDEHEFAYRHSFFSGKNYIIIWSEIKLEKANDATAVRALMEEHMTARNTKQPLEYPSAGSVFKRYPGYYTSKLIDEAGLRGYSIGGAQVSVKHCGFIVNRGGATANDVKALIEHIKSVIREKNGIEIECEVRFVG